jgi:hypothetical protein
MSGEVIPMSREPMALSNPGTEVALIAAMLALNECIDPVADLVAPRISATTSSATSSGWRPASTARARVSMC